MRTAFILVGVTAATLVLPLYAQKCDRTDTYITCWNRFNAPQDQEQEEAVTEKKGAEIEAAASSTATGLTNLLSPSESPLKDFLSLLDASFETATSAEDGQAFTFD